MKRILQLSLLLLLTLSLLLPAVGCKGGEPPYCPPAEDDETGETPGTGPENGDPNEETPPVTPPAPILPTGTQPSAILSTSNNIWLSMTAHLSIPAFTDLNGVNCRVVQGGCTDGTYYYAALNDGKSSDAKSISAIRKYDLASGKLLATFEGLQICHCNDMTYNPNTNELLMVHNAPERWVISVFDGDTMLFKRKIEILPEIYSLSYDPYENCYWAGLSYGFDFIKMDTDLKQIGEVYTGEITGYTKQGMDVDDKYIYFLQYKENSIIVYDKGGTFIKKLLLPRTAYEAEHIFHIGETFYIAYYNSPGGGTLYKTVASEIENKTLSATMTELSVLERYTDANNVLYKVPQGSCTDGTYVYLAMNNDVSGGYLTVIYKINPQTGAVLATYEGYSTGLTNDMTYNSKTDQIVISHNKNDPTKLTVLDADTLELVRTVTLSKQVFCIAYDATQDCYFAGLSGSYDFARLNADFEITETYGGHNSGYTKQAVDCDGSYLYFLQSATNSISVYRTDGAFIGHYALPVAGSNTAQSICHIGNTFYIGYNDSSAGGILYSATLTLQ